MYIDYPTKIFGFISPFLGFGKLRPLRLLDRRTTLEYALKYNCSIARLGDGEMRMTFCGSKKDIHFQKFDKTLSERLSNVLTTPVDNLLVCFSNGSIQNTRQYIVTDYERNPNDYIKHISVHKPNDVGILLRKRERHRCRKQLAVVCRKTFLRVLGDATCFIISSFFKEYVENRILEICNLYRRFLQGKRILIVCPDTPMLGVSFRKLVENGVIQSPKQVDFLSVPDHDCFDHYGEILKGILGFRSMDAVFIQAGPTATVLVAELMSQHGLLAYDVGSLNISLQKVATIHEISF